MEEILVALLQFAFELVLNVLSYFPFDWPSKHRSSIEPESVAGWCVLWASLGAAMGGLSLLLFEHSLIHASWLRMLTLVSSPLLSAYLSQGIAVARVRNNSNIIPRNHFWYAFWFSLGVAVVRFIYAKH
ncbi:MAG: hypothetical protein HY273_08500 [Gammaproteobacteria bacterium]|nr:hypothetical protein [Gammaproteobacteria bacterium]